MHLSSLMRRSWAHFVPRKCFFPTPNCPTSTYSWALGIAAASRRSLMYLAGCGMLRHLTLSMVNALDIDCTPLTLPKLELLDVRDRGTELCRYLTAPALHKIVFRMENIDPEDEERWEDKELTALLALAQRCGDQITSLSIGFETLAEAESVEALREVLLALPGVTEFELLEGLGKDLDDRLCCIDGDFFEENFLYKEDEPVFPNLTRLSLHIRQMSWHSDDVDQLKAMVESRRKDGVLGRATSHGSAP